MKPQLSLRRWVWCVLVVLASVEAAAAARPAGKKHGAVGQRVAVRSKAAADDNVKAPPQTMLDITRVRRTVKSPDGQVRTYVTYVQN